MRATVAADDYYRSGKSSIVSLKIKQATQTLKLTPINQRVSYNKGKTYQLKVKAQENPKLTFAKLKGTSYIKVSKTGVVTVNKKIKKGTYYVKTKVTADATKNYQKKSQEFTLCIKVL